MKQDSSKRQSLHTPTLETVQSRKRKKQNWSGGATTHHARKRTFGCRQIENRNEPKQMAKWRYHLI